MITALLATTMAAPITLEHQARLLASDGSPRSGSADVTVRLCNAATNGACTVAATLLAVPFDDGYASLPFPVDTDTLAAGEVWVELQVDATPLAPRTRLSHGARAGVAEVSRGVRTTALSGATSCAEPDGALLFDTTAMNLKLCLGGTWRDAAKGLADVTLVSGARQWSNGSYAANCAAYASPPSGFVYSGATGDGLYRVDPNGDGTPTTTYCDMDAGGAHWTLLMVADGNSTTFGNNAPAWSQNTALGTATSPPANADFRSTSYGELITNHVRLCYQDTAHCTVFAHNQNRTLQAFFTGGHTYTKYSFNSAGYTNVGSTADRTTYLSELGLSTSTNPSNTCWWLGINETRSISSIGLLGDNVGGCTATGGIHDDLAVGVGLQSCNDNNSCPSGGSGHLAGQQRGWDGADTNYVRGPWLVFGR